jgi:putative membrane protein
MMTCCVADLSLTGVVCKYDRASQLEQESWVTVEGTLFIGEYEFDGQKYNEPQIEVTKVVPAEAVEGYVYPY